MAEKARPRILVVDDELEMAQALCDGLQDYDFDAVAVGSSHKALTLLGQQSFDAVVTDLRMPELDGLSLLAQCRRLAPERPVLVMTAYGAIDSAVESIRQGASHYLTKPFKLDELVLFLKRALEEARVRREASELRTTLRQRYGRQALIGQSPSMLALLDALERVADTDVPLLIGGETGTGKGLFAHAVHLESARQRGPFVSVNCGALPESLLESELFGHEKGAFTGATHARKGLLAEAEGGTLFLDEIGDISPALQVKLLHVLERGEIRPVGASRAHKVDVRIIAATHRDLPAAVRAGTFREDLLYRLDVVSIVLPALRHRRQDIPLLVDHFLQEQRARHPKAVVQRFSPEAMQRLLHHDWPGNVRQLAHLVERLVVLGRTAEVTAEDVTVALGAPTKQLNFEGEIVPIRVLQRQYAAWALAQVGGHRGRAAEKLGVDAKTLYNWLSEERAERERRPSDG
jgi:two-component system response regulator HydG